MKELFYAKMDDMKYMNVEAYEYLVQRNPNTWCGAFFNLDAKCVGHNKVKCENETVPKPPTVKKVSGRRKEPTVQNASKKGGDRGSRGGGRGAMDGSGGATSGGRGADSGGRATKGGSRGRRGGGRGRNGGGRESTSGSVKDIRQSMEHEYLQGLLDEQEDQRQKEEKEHQEKLDEEAFQQAMEEERMYKRMYLERMEPHLAPKQHVQVNKISSSCEIYSGPHDTQYCMKNPEQAFVEYASPHTDKAGGPEDEENMTIEGLKVEFFDIFSTRSELAYHKGLSNFTCMIKRMQVFIGNFTYIIDFMIVEDISSIIDPRLSQVVLGKPFVEISNMTHDPSIGVVKFTDEFDDIAYKKPHKIERYDSLSDLEKEHTKSVYLRNEVDKRRGVKYVMSKILGFYKECLELGPKYLTGVVDEGEVS
nr:retrotransposon Orf1 [Tanacetum cinerariifolium]